MSWAEALGLHNGSWLSGPQRFISRILIDPILILVFVVVALFCFHSCYPVFWLADWRFFFCKPWGKKPLAVVLLFLLPNCVTVISTRGQVCWNGKPEPVHIFLSLALSWVGLPATSSLLAGPCLWQAHPGICLLRSGFSTWSWAGGLRSLSLGRLALNSSCSSVRPLPASPERLTLWTPVAVLRLLESRGEKKIVGAPSFQLGALFIDEEIASVAQWEMHRL